MRNRVLAIASGGGHWQQLMRLRPAFQEQHAIYVTTNAAYAVDVPDSELFVVQDANRTEPWNLIRSASGMLFRVLKARPDVVISTGAAPGIFGIVFGDSLARERFGSTASQTQKPFLCQAALHPSWHTSR